MIVKEEYPDNELLLGAIKQYYNYKTDVSGYITVK